MCTGNQVRGTDGKCHDKEDADKTQAEPTGDQECTIDGKCPCDGSCSSPHQVFLHSGEEHLQRTDLVIAGRGGIHFEMKRTYRSQLNYNGPMGFGWTFNYDEGLFVEENGDITLVSSSARVDTWELQPDGSYNAPTGHFHSLKRLEDGSYVIREPNGFQRYYRDDGRLFCHLDRFDNIMIFDYDDSGNLSTVIDVFGREINFFFESYPDGVDRLTRVRDYMGREVVYTYDSLGDLVSARSPVIEGTSTGNDFPLGRTERYTYSSGFTQPELNHNLLSCTMPQEVATGGPPSMQWTYGNDPGDPSTFDKVLTETIGGTNASGVAAGGTRSFTYEKLNENEPAGQLDLPRGKATITERNGNVMEYYVNERQHHIITRELTRGVREGEPDYYETVSEYNEDGLLVRRIHPEGNEIRYAYDSDGPRHMQGNVIEVRGVADANRGGGDDLVTSYTYEPLFNRISSYTDPRGNTPGYVPPLGEASAERYTTRYFYDYQESSDPVSLAEEFGIDISGIERGLGDLNGDGRTDQVVGNVVRKQRPTVLLRSDSNQAVKSGSETQEVFSEYQWNDYGQPLADIDAEGNITQYFYYPENDPDGDGVKTFSPYRALGKGNSGYLASLVADAGLTPRRVTDVDPVAARTQFGYDPVGNIISILDPRGVLTALEVNPANEIIRLTRGADVSAALASGELIIDEDPFAYETRIHYDYNGRIVLNEVENRDGNTSGVGGFVEQRNTFDILGNLVREEQEVDASTTLVTEYFYDENENLNLVRQPEGNETATVYDERDLIFQITRGLGTAEESTTESHYDLNGNLIRTVDAEDNDGDGNPEERQLIYDGFDRLIEVVDALGNRAVNTYDVASDVVEFRMFGHPAGQPEAPHVLHTDLFVQYDELRRPFRTDQTLFMGSGFNPIRAPELLDDNDDGLVTNLYEYDALNRSTFVVEDDGEVSETMYDGLSRAIGMSDQLGNMTAVDYDSTNNVIRVSSLEISPHELVPDEIFENHYVYDQLNRVVRATDNAGQTTRFRYDSRDNLIFRSDPEGTLIEDPLGIFPGEINGPGNTKHFLYDGFNRLIGQVADLREGGVGSGEIDTTNTYNPDGQVALAYTFDKNSRLTGIIDDNGNKTSYEYDSLNRMVRQVNANTNEVTSWQFDRDDNITQVIDPNGTVIQKNFDALHRLVSTSIDRADGVAGTTMELFEYDGYSRLTSAFDDNGEGEDQLCEFDYDSLSRQLEERFNGEPVSSVYTGDNNRLQCVYPGGRVIRQVFDTIDRVQTINDGTTATPSLISESHWIGPGYRELRRVNGNSTTLSYISNGASTYDAVKRVSQFAVLGPSENTIIDRDYGYNRADVRTFERRNDDFALTDHYAYDSMYRVTNTSLDRDGSGLQRDLTDVSYSYDGVGNRRSVNEIRTSTGSQIRDHSINAVNQYTSINAVSRAHSKNGNLKNDGEFQYVYDYKNRLVMVLRESDGSGVAEYTYYADNRRAQKTVIGAPNVVTEFFYDGVRVCEERSTDTGTTTWVYSPVYLDAPIQMETESGSFFLHQNARADVVAVTNSTGAAVERRFYDDFGRSYDGNKNPVASSAVGNPYGFQGRRLDPESGLMYFRNRYYSPDTGRFLQRDPVWDSNNVGGQYSFVGNGPLSGFDALGLYGDVVADNSGYGFGDFLNDIANAPDRMSEWLDKTGLPAMERAAESVAEFFTEDLANAGKGVQMGYVEVTQPGGDTYDRMFGVGMMVAGVFIIVGEIIDYATGPGKKKVATECTKQVVTRGGKKLDELAELFEQGGKKLGKRAPVEQLGEQMAKVGLSGKISPAKLDEVLTQIRKGQGNPPDCEFYNYLSLREHLGDAMEKGARSFRGKDMPGFHEYVLLVDPKVKGKGRLQGVIDTAAPQYIEKGNITMNQIEKAGLKDAFESGVYTPAQHNALMDMVIKGHQ